MFGLVLASFAASQWLVVGLKTIEPLVDQSW
jgi:hypothetical protein